MAAGPHRARLSRGADLLRLGAELAALALSRGGWDGAQRRRVEREIVVAAYANLLWFTLAAALAALVLTRIVVVTAQSYGLSRVALEMVVRVLVLELLPLAAAAFVAVRYALPAGRELAEWRRDGALDAWRATGGDVARELLLPRALAAAFAVLLLAAASGALVVVLAYAVAHGLSPWAWPGYMRTVGLVLSPAVSLVFLLKTLLFAAAVGLLPAAAVVAPAPRAARAAPELRGLVRVLALMLAIEAGSLLVPTH